MLQLPLFLDSIGHMTYIMPKFFGLADPKKAAIADVASGQDQRAVTAATSRFRGKFANRAHQSRARWREPEKKQSCARSCRGKLQIFTRTS